MKNDKIFVIILNILLVIVFASMFYIVNNSSLNISYNNKTVASSVLANNDEYLSSITYNYSNILINLDMLESKLDLLSSDIKNKNEEKIINNDICIIKEINKPSGLTEEQLDFIIFKTLKDKNKLNSKLLGTGRYIIDIENEYDINALFILSVASYMSDFGVTPVSENNLFSFYRNLSYVSYDNNYDSIYDFGYVINEYYFKRNIISINDISKIYSSSDTEWSNNINEYILLYEKYAMIIIQRFR